MHKILIQQIHSLHIVRATPQLCKYYTKTQCDKTCYCDSSYLRISHSLIADLRVTPPTFPRAALAVPRVAADFGAWAVGFGGAVGFLVPLAVEVPPLVTPLPLVAGEGGDFVADNARLGVDEGSCFLAPAGAPPMVFLAPTATPLVGFLDAGRVSCGLLYVGALSMPYCKEAD